MVKTCRVLPWNIYIRHNMIIKNLTIWNFMFLTFKYELVNNVW